MREIPFTSMAVIVVVSLVTIHLSSQPALGVFNGAENQAAPASASSTEIKVGLGIENLDLTGASGTFKIAPDTRIYVWARVKGIAEGKVVMLFSKGDKEFYRKEVAVPSVPYRINAYRTFRSGDAGDWKATVLGPDGKELAATAFKIEITK